MLSERSVTFIIPSEHCGGVKVTAVERDGNLVFSVEDVGRGRTSLRGLFLEFDESKLCDLNVTSTDSRVKRTRIDANDVLHGQSKHDRRGHGHSTPYDIGVFFGKARHGGAGPIEFTLDGSDALTLDDLAHMRIAAQIGDNKIIKTSIPAAPDAHDDSFVISEDVVNPTSGSPGVVLQLLENDDGRKLKITQVDGAQHGTVTIVDGDDADHIAGDAVLYVPDADYAGTDSFEYVVSSGGKGRGKGHHGGHAGGVGGKDSAVVDIDIEAVADAPELSYEILSGDAVNEIIVKVKALTTDGDGSEYIDRIELGGLPVGVAVAQGSLNPGDQAGSVTQEFRLTLPMGESTNFDLSITAVSKETSNGDEEMASLSTPIVFEYQSTTVAAEFSAIDQSIWNTGESFTFVGERSFAIETGDFDESISQTVGPATVTAGISGHIKLAVDAALNVEGGEIDADAAYDVTVETNYNKTTDQLLIGTDAVLNGVSFNTEGPTGSILLDVLYDVLLDAYASVNVNLGPFGSIDRRVDLPTIDLGPGPISLAIDSEAPAAVIVPPAPFDGLTIGYDWPELVTSGSSTSNPVVSSGVSNNVAELDLDVDQLLAQLLGAPAGPLSIDLGGGVLADVDLRNVDVSADISFLQQFELEMGDLTGVLSFEDGSTQAFAIGDSVTIDGASAVDAAGDGDGQVEFTLDVVPTASLTNETALGVNVGATGDYLSLGYHIGLAAGVTVLGPIADFNETLFAGSMSIFDQTFGLNFGEQSFSFAA